MSAAINSPNFVVAAIAAQVIIFADDEDEFGIARLRPECDCMTDYGLVGNLQDAISIIQTKVT